MRKVLLDWDRGGEGEGLWRMTEKCVKKMEWEAQAAYNTSLKTTRVSDYFRKTEVEEAQREVIDYLSALATPLSEFNGRHSSAIGGTSPPSDTAPFRDATPSTPTGPSSLQTQGSYSSRGGS
ncbi:hypothetical protein C352_04402 [Cryptococcus neoformans CHC193]|nr:hypothetical protein C352_04402 [Cryptococcus neoformans var. grubii CHC193]